MPRKLKVFRTPIGFHDAYVAVPSQKAALEAWGADANLFARGVAEEVTDAAAMEEPLAKPGIVIRKVRGTMEQHLAALPPTPKSTTKRRAADEKPSKRTKGEGAKKPPPKPKPKPPRPSRAALDQAEAAVAAAEQSYAEARRGIAAEEAELSRRKRKLDRDRERETELLDNARDKAEADYRRALADWHEL